MQQPNPLRTVARIHGIARRLERRVRRTPDTDIEHAAALLRPLMDVITDEQKAMHRTAGKRGRLH
jgi:hypothetical protein